MKKILILIIKITLTYIRNIYYRNKIFYIVDFYNWANLNDAKNLKKFFKDKFIISYFYKGIRNSIIHIGSHYKIFNNDKINLNQSNKLFVFWPHLDKNNRISYKLKKMSIKLIKSIPVQIYQKKI